MKHGRFFINTALVCVVIYALVAFSSPVAAAGTVVSVNSAALVQQGEDFSASIMVTDVTDFDAAQYDVTYNPAIIQLSGVTGGLIGSTTIPISQWRNIASGTTRVINNVPNAPGVTGSGYLAVIT